MCDNTLIESEPPAGLAFGGRENGAKLFDFSQVESMDYFINDLEPSVIMINVEQYLENYLSSSLWRMLEYFCNALWSK